MLELDVIADAPAPPHSVTAWGRKPSVKNAIATTTNAPHESAQGIKLKDKDQQGRAHKHPVEKMEAKRVRTAAWLTSLE